MHRDGGGSWKGTGGDGRRCIGMGGGGGEWKEWGMHKSCLRS